MGSNADWKKINEDQVVQWQRKQHAVKNWIEEILGMELESEDLADPLQTGVVLCHVMRRLDERGTHIERGVERIHFFPLFAFPYYFHR
jgi:hypothetical protein